jgi:hypothetical protein
MKVKPLVMAMAVTLSTLPAARAGLCSDATGEPRHDFQFIAGFSPGSPTWIGTAPDRRLALAGFGYSYRYRMLSSVSVSYTAAVFPAAILIQADSHAVYGFAIAPVGFTFEFARRRRMHPFAETLGGVIVSTEPIPENLPNASSRDFLFDFGGGVRWQYGPRRAVSLGYRFLHISNAGTTRFNPGVDNNVVYVECSFLR